MTTLLTTFPVRRPAGTVQFRGVLARSNHYLIAHLPQSWIFWFALPHEIWHYLAARLLGLRARLVPGATLFDPTTRWKSIAVLMAPATIGLVWPLMWLPIVQALSGRPPVTDWFLLAVMILGWWGGCLGDFIDAWLLLAKGESKAQHRARMQRMVGRYTPEMAGAWQAVPN